MPPTDRLLSFDPLPVILRSPPNWTAVWFFAALGSVHWCIAIPALVRGHWEGYLSLLLGAIFLAAAGLSRLCRHEIAVLPGERRVRVRDGFRRLCFERSIPFDDVRGVRLTLPTAGNDHDARIELLSDADDIECPPTSCPREEALCLAVTLQVRLIKISPEDGPVPNRLNSL